MLRLRIKLTMFKVNNDGTRTSPMTPCCSVSIVNIKHVITGWAVIGVELKSQIIKRKPLTSTKLTFPYRSLIVRIKVFGILHPLFYSPFPVICFELIVSALLSISHLSCFSVTPSSEKVNFPPYTPSWAQWVNILQKWNLQISLHNQE